MSDKGSRPILESKGIIRHEQLGPGRDCSLNVWNISLDFIFFKFYIILLSYKSLRLKSLLFYSFRRILFWAFANLDDVRHNIYCNSAWNVASRNTIKFSSHLLPTWNPSVTTTTGVSNGRFSLAPYLGTATCLDFLLVFVLQWSPTEIQDSGNLIKVLI